MFWNRKFRPDEAICVVMMIGCLWLIHCHQKAAANCQKGNMCFSHKYAMFMFVYIMFFLFVGRPASTEFVKELDLEHLNILPPGRFWPFHSQTQWRIDLSVLLYSHLRARVLSGWRWKGGRDELAGSFWFECDHACNISRFLSFQTKWESTFKELLHKAINLTVRDCCHKVCFT